MGAPGMPRAAWRSSRVRWWHVALIVALVLFTGVTFAADGCADEESRVLWVFIVATGALCAVGLLLMMVAALNTYADE